VGRSFGCLAWLALVWPAGAQAQQLEPAPPPTTDVVDAAPLPVQARVWVVQPWDGVGGRGVIRDSAAWASLWSNFYRTYGENFDRPPPVGPRVDFTRDMVLVVASAHLQVEDSLSVDSLGLSDSVTTVVVRHFVGCGILPAGRPKALFVTLPQRPQPTRFVQRVEQRCREVPG
jgi:hypothetical protein